jgi:hypothetical protein
VVLDNVPVLIGGYSDYHGCIIAKKMVKVKGELLESQQPPLKERGLPPGGERETVEQG